MPTDTSSRLPPRDGPPVETVYERLDHLVQADPQQAIVEARLLARTSANEPSLMLEVWAAIGRALYELGDMHRAPQAMRQALRSGASLGHDDRLISIRISAAAVFAESGELSEALYQLDQAEHASSGATLGRVHTQRAFILSHAGRLVEALQHTDLADAAFRKSGDKLGRLRLLVNRSLIYLQLRDLAAAEADLVKARSLAERLDQVVIAAGIVANLGVLHGRAGRTLRALAHFDLARDQYVAAGKPLRAMAIMEADRAETLLHAGMFAEAVSASHLAVANAGASGSVAGRGDAELLLARAQLAAGDLRAAQRTAATASRTMRDGGRSGVSLQARAVGLEAALGLVTGPSQATNLLDRSRRVAHRLDRYGWSEVGDDLRCARLRCASRLNRIHDVEEDLALLRGSRGSRRPSVALRGWYAESLARWHSADFRAAMHAARSGMKALERHRRSAADLEFRAGLSAIGADLAALAVQLATGAGGPGGVFTWAERTRANAFRVESISGVVDKGIPRMADVVRELGHRTMVEYVIDRDLIWAVVLGSRRPRLVRLGSLDEVMRASDQLAGWMTRGTQPNDPGRVADAKRVAARLEELLVAPLGLRVDDEVVLVPVGQLHAVPWSSLATAAMSQFVVCPSARLWLEAERRSQQSRCHTTSLLMGPDVLGASLERKAIARLYQNPKVLAGNRATVGALRTLFAEFDVVQVAAHGTFRPDRPMMSSLRLHGGNMTIYDLASATVNSRVIVLSSCEGGVHGVNSGSEVLGLASVLLSLGCATIVAPTHTVADRVCAEFVSDMHAEWCSGVPIAQAVSTVRRRWLADPTLTRWATASAFTCFGSGSSAMGAAAVGSV